MVWLTWLGLASWGVGLIGDEPKQALPSASGGPSVTGQAWPAFRGDGRSVTSARHLPLEWSPQENIAYRVQLPGYGQSSPVVWNDQVYLTAVDGDQKEKLYVVALRLGDGKRLWQKEFDASQKGRNNPMMSRAAATPVVDAQGVYCFFESGDLFALRHDGSLRWQRSLSKDYGPIKNNHELASSPVQYNDLIFVLVDHSGPSYLAAIDKSSGQTRWKAERPSRTSWTSPVVTEVAGTPVVIVASGDSVTAYEAATGKVLATLEGLVGLNIASPTANGEWIVIGAGVNRLKPDVAASARSNCLLRLQQKDGQWSLTQVWPGKKAVSAFASPLIYAGHVYFLTREGLVYCVDAHSGAERYVERLDDEVWATPIAAGDRLYFFGKKGVTVVLKSGGEFEKLAVNRLWTPQEYAERLAQARKEAEKKLPPPIPPGKNPPGGPVVPPEEMQAVRYATVGDVVYGVAAVDGGFLIRTGTELIAVGRPGNPDNAR
ncbi:MAG: PQQ-binding-like beta-propeller repeat protein [Gemmataceae bacterium]|nr:PQQ-binding-like beta-propeller repeat protein [Gemmataceae bacterium]